MSTTPAIVDGRNTPIVVFHSFFYVCPLLQSQLHFQTRATTSSPKVTTTLASQPARSTYDGSKRYQVVNHHDTPNVTLPSSASHTRSGTHAAVLYYCVLNYVAALSPSLFELRLVDDIDNFLFFSALPFCVERVWLWQLLEVADDSEDDGERNGGWRMMIWICYVGFVQVQDESDNWGIGRRWICWVNQGATMGYGVLVGIPRMNVLFFFLQRTEWEKAPMSEEGESPEWRDSDDICCASALFPSHLETWDKVESRCCFLLLPSSAIMTMAS